MFAEYNESSKFRFFYCIVIYEFNYDYWSSIYVSAWINYANIYAKNPFLVPVISIFIPSDGFNIHTIQIHIHTMKSPLNNVKIEKTTRFLFSRRKLLQSFDTVRLGNTSAYVLKFPKHRFEASAFENRTVDVMTLLGRQCYE